MGLSVDSDLATLLATSVIIERPHQVMTRTSTTSRDVTKINHTLIGIIYDGYIPSRDDN